MYYAGRHLLQDGGIPHRLVPSLAEGARPLESYVMSYHFKSGVPNLSVAIPVMLASDFDLLSLFLLQD